MTRKRVCPPPYVEPSGQIYLRKRRSPLKEDVCQMRKQEVQPARVRKLEW
jgi:hypothetical protein